MHGMPLTTGDKWRDEPRMSDRVSDVHRKGTIVLRMGMLMGHKHDLGTESPHMCRTIIG